MSGVKKLDKVRNAHIHGSTKVASVVDKLSENRLRLYGRVQRRDGGHMVRRGQTLEVEGAEEGVDPRRDGRTASFEDLRAPEIDAIQNRSRWKGLIAIHDPE